MNKQAVFNGLVVIALYMYGIHRAFIEPVSQNYANGRLQGGIIIITLVIGYALLIVSYNVYKETRSLKLVLSALKELIVVMLTLKPIKRKHHTKKTNKRTK